MCCICPDAPPERVARKGSYGARDQILLSYAGAPHMFALGLKDACCAEPACCCLSSCGTPCGCTACWARQAVLEQYYKEQGGMAQYTCCQGYIPGVCCLSDDCCKGSPLGLCLEGFCCPLFSLSIARIHLMEVKRIRPDPCDWQIIAFANFMQCLACILDVLSIFIEQLKDAAQLVECIADLVTVSVAGCMGAQIKHEIAKDVAAGQLVFVVVQGVPVNPAGQPIVVAQPVGGAPPAKPEEMER